MMRRAGSARLLAGLILASLGVLAQPASKASGHWEGTLEAPNQKVGIVVDLSKSAAGLWTGSFSIPQANTRDIPVEKISVEGPVVRFAVPGFPGSPSFEGKLSADGMSLAGTATARNTPIPFQLKRTGEAKVNLPPPSSVLPKDFEGTWEGTLDANGNQLRIVVKLAPATDGAATGALISVDQGNQPIPIDTITITGRQLKFEVRLVGGTFLGALGANGEISGNWSQGPNSVPLTLKRAAASTP